MSVDMALGPSTRQGAATDESHPRDNRSLVVRSFVVRHWFTIAVIAVSCVLHLWDLGQRPLAHDEAIDARFSWQARSGAVIQYDPVYHGPLRFYVEGFVLNHFGTSPAWTRVVAALAGIASTVIIATSARLLGRFGAPLAALAFAISPTILTVTRTGREDSLVGLVSLALLVVIANALIDPKPRHIIGAGALVAASFGLKETTFLFGFAGATFFAALAMVAWARPSGAGRAFWARLRTLGKEPWMWCFIVFVATFMFIFTSAFRYSDGFKSGLVDGIKYWWSQHDVGRGSQQWFFYATIFAAYEWLLMGVALLGLIVTVRRRSIVGAWFATMAIVQFALYSWAGEKFAWLALHPLLPTVLLAALGAEAAVQRLRRIRTTRSAAVWSTVAATAVIAAGTLVIAIPPAITNGADPAELLVTVQTSEAVPAITARLAAARRDGAIGRILVDERSGGSWPWAWYLQGFSDVAYATIDETQPLPPGFDVYIVDAATPAPPVPDGYTIQRFSLRGWWLPDYDSMGLGDIVRWLTTRRTWNPTGSSDQFLIIKTQAAATAAASGEAG